jgi:CRP/FNR family transcriptional regulator, cyclic AMP receptor protein
MNQSDLDGHNVVKIPKGKLLFKESDLSRDLYIIKTGQARVFKTEGGVDIDLDMAGPGAVVGEISALDGGTRSASVVALTDIEAVQIPIHDFDKVAGRMPEWFQKIAKILVQRLREVDGKIDLSKGGDKQGHAAALLSLMTYSTYCTVQDQQYSFGETFVENELVDLLNMPVNEAVEAIDKLEKHGCLKRDRGRIVVTDRSKLEEFGKRVFQSSDETPAL